MNQEYPISIPGVFYIHNDEHRNSNPKKSQWIISKWDERECFDKAASLHYTFGFGGDGPCWGLYTKEKIVRYLGIAAAHSVNPGKELFIAKFIQDNRTSRWHGYPADTSNNHQDIPSSDILDYWKEGGYLSRAKIRKISRGQKCKL